MKLPAVDHDAARFCQYPMFSWATPALLYGGFFGPLAGHLAYSLYSGSCVVPSLPVQAIASLCGMQMRELMLFTPDLMMTAHHLTTAALSVLIWGGLRSRVFGRLPPGANEGGEISIFVLHPNDCAYVDAAALGAAAMEFGSVGVCLWSLYGSPSRHLYLLVMAISHLTTLVAGGLVFSKVGKREREKEKSKQHAHCSPYEYQDMIRADRRSRCSSS